MQPLSSLFLFLAAALAPHNVALAQAQSTAAFCGVVTIPLNQYTGACASDVTAAMAKACTDIKGTVGGQTKEPPGMTANCITYCNNVPDGGHDTQSSIPGLENEGLMHVYVVDKCDDCTYCGGS